MAVAVALTGFNVSLGSARNGLEVIHSGKVVLGSTLCFLRWSNFLPIYFEI